MDELQVDAEDVYEAEGLMDYSALNEIADTDIAELHWPRMTVLAPAGLEELIGIRFSSVASGRPTSPLRSVFSCTHRNCAVLQCKYRATVWHIGDLRTRRGAVSCNSTATAAFASLDTARQFHATSTATLKSFKSRLSLLLQRARSQFEPAIKSRSHSPASDRQATAR